MTNISIVCVCVMFAMSVAQLNVVKRDYFTTKDRRILPSSTSIIELKARSLLVCASLCTIYKACCVASYDRKSKQCRLDESCCPESEPSEDALMLKNSTVSFSCPNRWLKYEHKCFYFSEEEKTWDEARLTCEYYGSSLVEVGSSCEIDFLKKTATVYGKSYWLGGSDIQSEGRWMWVSSLTKFTLTDWAAGEPSNTDGEDCIRMSLKFDLKWGDTSCSTKLRFICEKK